MFIYTHPVYPRRAWERIFKQLYNVGMLLNFAAFIISFTSFMTRVENTFSGFFSSQSFKLSNGLQAVLANCQYRAPLTVLGYTASVSISIDSLPFMFLTLQNFYIGIFAIHIGLIFCDFVAKAFFALNIRHLRYKGLSINIVQILVQCVFVNSAAVIIAIAASASARQFAKTYIDTCTTQFLVSNEAKFVAAESDLDVVFGTNLDFIVAAVAINAFFYACAAVHLVLYSMKETNTKLLIASRPWEKGFLCKPDKLLLIEYCRQRKQVEEDILAQVDSSEEEEDEDDSTWQKPSAAKRSSRAALDQQRSESTGTATGGLLASDAGRDFESGGGMSVAPAEDIEVEMAGSDPRFMMMGGGAGGGFDVEGEEGMEGGAGYSVPIDDDGAARARRRHRRHRRDMEDAAGGAAIEGEGVDQAPSAEGERGSRRHRHRRRREAPTAAATAAGGFSLDADQQGAAGTMGSGDGEGGEPEELDLPRDV